MREEKARQRPAAALCKHVGHAGASGARLREQLRPNDSSADRVFVRQWNDQLFPANICPQRPLADVLGVHPQHLRERGARLLHFARTAIAGLQRPATPGCFDRKDTRGHLQREGVSRQPHGARNMGGAQRRMSGKWHLVLRCENTHPGTGSRGRKNERGLRQVELQRQRLHRRRIQRSAVFEDAQRIAAETLVPAGKHIHETKAESFHGAIIIGA